MGKCGEGQEYEVRDTLNHTDKISFDKCYQIVITFAKKRAVIMALLKKGQEQFSDTRYIIEKGNNKDETFITDDEIQDYIDKVINDKDQNIDSIPSLMTQ